MRPLSRFSCRVAISIFLSASLSAPAHATWPHDPNNGNVPVCTAVSAQVNPKIIADGSGGTIVAWIDYRNAGSADIYVQRVNAAGVSLWTANGVALCTATNEQYDPMLISDGAGGAIVTWYDYRSGASDIYAQRVSAAGAPQWTGNGVAICAATGNQYSPVITSDGSGGAIITWYDFRNGNNDVFVQRVNGAGAAQWAVNGIAVCNATGDQFFPVIASDGAGGALLTWYDYRAGSADIYAQRLDGSGASQWTPNGIALCSATGDQFNPIIIADGSGGGVIAWLDQRAGITNDIYAQRVNAAGTALWAVNGMAICTATGDQSATTMASDGAGGAILAWRDDRTGTGDIYAQRASAAGVAQWTANGVALCTAASTQNTPVATSDGSGGAIVAWSDLRNGNYDVYAQRINGVGTPQWASNGVAVCTAVGDDLSPTLALDATSAAIIAWSDQRTPFGDIYAQRVESLGYLGSPEPLIASARDVAGDQGGQVKVSWDASYLEFAPYSGVIGSYQIFRSVPPNYAAHAAAQGARIVPSSEPVEAGDRKIILASPANGQAYYWEYVGTQSAYQFSGYSYLAPTEQDSTAVSNLRTYFLVRAVSSPTVFWNSNPDSGYSVDNIGPAAPAPFTGAYSAGATKLHWGANGEGDLAGYRLYRGSSSGFVPGPGNLISAQPDTGYSDAGPAGRYYKLSAVDIHGNESSYALLTPSGTLDSGPIVPRALALALTSSNPARGAASFRYGLAEPAAFQLSIYDLAGRQIQQLERSSVPAGEYVARWNGCDASGRAVGGGVYLARLSAGAQARVVRFILLR